MIKEGLNISEIAKYHNMLKDEVPLRDIARHLHVNPAILEGLTPEKMAEAKVNAKRIANESKKQREAKAVAVEGAVAGAIRSVYEGKQVDPRENEGNDIRPIGNSDGLTL